MGGVNDWTDNRTDMDSGGDERRRAKVSPVFKQKIMELASDDIQELTTETQMCQLRDELDTREKYYVKKIRFYLDEAKVLESEAEKLRTTQLELLLTIKDLKNRISELEAKNTFYKNRLRKQDEKRMNMIV